MISISVRSNAADLQRKLHDLAQKQIPFAMAMAINDVAKQAKTDVQAEMKKVFRAPVARTLNSIRIKYATKANPKALIYIDAEPNKGIAPAKYLAAEILGGPRSHKRFEKAFQAAGLMPPGTFAVPGSAAPLDGNGNIPANFLVQLLSYFQAFGEQGYRANMTQKRKARIHQVGRSERGYKTIGGRMYFAANGRSGRTRHLKPGIYAKSGTHGVNVVPVILFVSSASYSVRLPFDKIVTASVRKHYPAKFRERLNKAIATAK